MDEKTISAFKSACNPLLKFLQDYNFNSSDYKVILSMDEVKLVKEEAGAALEE